MNPLIKALSVSLLLITSAPAHSFPEIPFCPGGGPPGWMNYFDYKRDQNIWQHHMRSNNTSAVPYHYRKYQYYTSPAQGRSPYQVLRQHYPINANTQRQHTYR